MANNKLEQGKPEPQRVGDWFFLDSPDCTDRFSVQEWTHGGSSIVCSTPYIHDRAKRQLQEIVKSHNKPYAASQPLVPPAINFDDMAEVLSGEAQAYITRDGEENPPGAVARVIKRGLKFCFDAGKKTAEPLVPQQEPTNEDLFGEIGHAGYRLSQEDDTADPEESYIAAFIWTARETAKRLRGVPSEQGTPPQEREFCEGCDHGVVAGKVCELCGGTGQQRAAQ